MTMSSKTDDDQLPPKLRRKLSRLHKQIAAAGAADWVQPPPVLNRRTGEEHPFGPRRAYDGAWALEMLGASGCTRAEVDAAIFVLEPLNGHGVKIDKGLLKLLANFHEPVPARQLVQMRADCNRSRFHVVERSADVAKKEIAL
jgi:hypothetical protein